VSYYLGCAALFVIGLYCLAVNRNLIKVAIGLLLMDQAVALVIVRVKAPLLVEAGAALIGLATILFLAAVILKIFDRTGSLDAGRLDKLKG
jgi:multisubunit Na+/H+ antiporter MnhC subunit